MAYFHRLLFETLALSPRAHTCPLPFPTPTTYPAPSFHTPTACYPTFPALHLPCTALPCLLHTATHFLPFTLPPTACLPHLPYLTTRLPAATLYTTAFLLSHAPPCLLAHPSFATHLSPSCHAPHSLTTTYKTITTPGKQAGGRRLDGVMAGGRRLGVTAGRTPSSL